MRDAEDMYKLTYNFRLTSRADPLLITIGRKVHNVIKIELKIGHNLQCDNIFKSPKIKATTIATFFIVFLHYLSASNDNLSSSMYIF